MWVCVLFFKQKHYMAELFDVFILYILETEALHTIHIS